MLMNKRIEAFSDLLALLEEILSSPVTRQECIKKFQDYVFHHGEPIQGANSSQWDVLNELAMDLDYYEPDTAMRREDPTFYGDERLEREIQEALNKLHVQA